MTSKEMSALEHAQTARDFLVASDREFDAGDHLQGSEKLYGAATQVIIAICQQRGWKYNSHRSMKWAVAELSRELGDIMLTGGFVAAENFHRNFFHDHMEDYERESDRPTVHGFVGRMLTLVDGADGDGSGP